MSKKHTYQQLQEENIKLMAELKRKKAKLTHALEDLAEKNKDMTDSINYALLIQQAIMPPDYLVKKHLPDSFILYKPKDIVSGDFYFVEKKRNKAIFAAVDSTGHGVPGALISVVGFNYLNQAVNEKGLTKPSDILSFLDEGVNDTLRQTADESGVKDGMDLAMCTLDYNTLKLQYAGAYNSLYYIKGKELTEIKSDKIPIGVNVKGIIDQYTNHTVQLEKGNMVYLFSDGYVDQFGGPKGRKYMSKRFREQLLKIQHLSMDKQKEHLNKTIEEWQGKLEQVDDILVIGVRV